jgi:hypothetical protein
MQIASKYETFSQECVKSCEIDCKIKSIESYKQNTHITFVTHIFLKGKKKATMKVKSCKESIFQQFVTRKLK